MAVELNTPCALLVNECQRGLVEPEHALFPGIAQQAQARGILPRIVRLAEAFRAGGQPVIFIHVSHRPDFAGVAVNNPAVAYVRRVGGLCEGSVQVEPVPELAPHPSDHRVLRHSGMTVFYGNHLDSLLRNLQVRTLVLAGVSTNAAIPGMLLGGLDRGFQCVVPEDCIAGADPVSHDALMTHLIRPLAQVGCCDEVIAALAAR
jgi:nicotinamidase-related amidase